MSLANRFFTRLPVRSAAADGQVHLLSAAESRRLRRLQGGVMALAALLSVLGFLAYYLPIYQYPESFPSLHLSLPILGATRLAWGELLWGVALTVAEMWALVFLNIVSVHEVAVATGFLRADNKPQQGDAVLRIGLEKKAQELSQYGIDPFQGMNRWLLFLFNVVLRLKGWLGNQAIRYLTRLLLGRYAVRSVLDFAGMPLYMAINAYSVYAVVREARVILMGQTLIALLTERLPRLELAAAEKELVYDTLQFIAMSKRDFHHNHYLLTKALLAHLQIPPKQYHQLSAGYFETLDRAPAHLQALCRLIILLGFILDGQLSWRERRRLRRLNEAGIVQENAAEVRGALRDFLNGAGINRWGEPYILRLEQESPEPQSIIGGQQATSGGSLVN